MEKSDDDDYDMITNYINDDIALSILSKLPLKSFKRFECVRKSWSLLFDNPSFMTMYRRDFISKCSYDDDSSLILCFNVHNKLYSLSGKGFENMVELGWQVQNHDLEFLDFGCVNGILCFEDIIWHKIVLWNPATDELKVVPSSPFESFSSPATLNFDAAVSFLIEPEIHGFGYDCVGNDYKLIRNVSIIPDFDTNRLSDRDISLQLHKSLDPFWEIYSLKSDSWKKLDIDMPIFNGFLGSHHVYMDGACHWLNLNVKRYYHVSAFLISFDLSSEVFITTPIPSYAGETMTELSVLNESIAVLNFQQNIGTIDISVLGELGAKESWFKLFTVGPLPRFETLLPYFEIFGVGKKGEIFYKYKDSELVWIDLNTNRINRLRFKAEEFSDRGRIVVYNKSMLSLEEISN